MEDNLINLLTWAAQQNSLFTNSLEDPVSKTRDDLGSFEDDPPTYMSVVGAPDQAIRGRSRSDISNTNLSTLGQTVDIDIDQDQTTQVSKILSALSPFRVLRSLAPNLTPVDQLRIDWPLRKWYVCFSAPLQLLTQS